MNKIIEYLPIHSRKQIIAFVILIIISIIVPIFLAEYVFMIDVNVPFCTQPKVNITNESDGTKLTAESGLTFTTSIFNKWWEKECCVNKDWSLKCQ
jgi:hypothetical protein